MRRIVAAGWVCVALPAFGQTAFTMRAGEWESTTSFANAPASEALVNRQCQHDDRSVDATSLSSMMAGLHGDCDTPQLSVAGDVASYRFSCTSGGIQMQMHGTMTRTGADAFTNHIVSHLEGGIAGAQDMDMTNVSRRVGDCPKVERPG